MQNTLKDKVKALLSEADGVVLSSWFFYSEADCDDFSVKSTYVEGTEEFGLACKEAGIRFENEDSYGGEGQGDQYWSVYSFTDGKDVVYVKFDGYYASYVGSEYSDWFFVEPKQVQVTQYFAV